MIFRDTAHIDFPLLALHAKILFNYFEQLLYNVVVCAEKLVQVHLMFKFGWLADLIGVGTLCLTVKIDPSN
jgi:hypothetical protein